MKKLALVISILFILCGFAAASPTLTAVSATLQDSSTQVWANATWIAEFSPRSGYNGSYNNNGSAITSNQTGVADGSGSFTVNLDDNLAVSPTGSGWKFTICPFASVSNCNTIVLTITGASQDISSQLNAILTIPHVTASQTLSRAYDDSEAFGTYGAIYINNTTSTIRQCAQLSCAGSGWSAISAGGGTVTSVFGRTGVVVAVSGDYSVGQVTGAAPLASPTFTGVPAAPTAAPGTNTTQLATTAFVIANSGGGGGGGSPLAPNGSTHSLVFNNTLTFGLGDGNTYPSNMWSKLGGTLSVGSNVASLNVPPHYQLITTTGLANAQASLSEDAIAQQWNYSIWGGYTCYCKIDTGTGHLVWFGFSSVLYGSLVAVNPNATIWGFRWAQGTDTNWQAYVSISNVTFTATDTGIAPDTNFHQFGMVRNSLNGIDYYIDGTKVATIASGATGFPGTTNAYLVNETALLVNATDQAIYIQGVRAWYKF